MTSLPSYILGHCLFQTNHISKKQPVPMLDSTKCNLKTSLGFKYPILYTVKISSPFDLSHYSDRGKISCLKIFKELPYLFTHTPQV